MKLADRRREKVRRKYLKPLRPAGWKPFDKRNDVIADGIRVYLCDVETGSLFTAALSQTNFEQAIVENVLPYDTVSDTLGSLIQELASGKLLLDEQINYAFTYAAALYIAGTHAYATVRQRVPNPQLLVLRYFDHSQNCHILRPTALMHADVLSPEAIESYVQLVLDTDRLNHPARFASTEVIPFRLTPRPNEDTNGHT